MKTILGLYCFLFNLVILVIVCACMGWSLLMWQFWAFIAPLGCLNARFAEYQATFVRSWLIRWGVL